MIQRLFCFIIIDLFFCVVDPLSFALLSCSKIPSRKWIRDPVCRTDTYDMRPCIWDYDLPRHAGLYRQTAMCKYTDLHRSSGVSVRVIETSWAEQAIFSTETPSLIDWFPLLYFSARQEYGWSTSTCYRCGSIMVGFYSIRHVNNKGRTRYGDNLFVICLYR